MDYESRTPALDDATHGRHLNQSTDTVPGGAGVTPDEAALPSN